MAQTMPDIMPETWIAGELNPALSAAAETVVPNRPLSKRAMKLLSFKVESIASGSSSTMPPIVQFAMHAVAWCRMKLKGGVSVCSPLRLVSQLPLGGKRSLSLIEVDGLRFLVGGGADSVTIIVPVSRTAFTTLENAAGLHALDIPDKQAETVRER